MTSDAALGAELETTVDPILIRGVGYRIPCFRRGFPRSRGRASVWPGHMTSDGIFLTVLRPQRCAPRVWTRVRLHRSDLAVYGP
jgi:hypothetical protein